MKTVGFIFIMVKIRTSNMYHIVEQLFICVIYDVEV